MRTPHPRRLELDSTEPDPTELDPTELVRPTRRDTVRRWVGRLRTAALVVAIVALAGFGLANLLDGSVWRPSAWAIAVPIFGVVAMFEINAMLRRAPYRTTASRRLRRRAVARAEGRRVRDPIVPNAAPAVRRGRRTAGEGAPSVIVRLIFAIACVAFLANFVGVPGAICVCAVWLAFMRFLHRRREPNALSRTQARRLADVFGTEADLPAQKPKAVRPRVVALSTSDER